MTRIIMSGCNGRMGQMITSMVETDETAEIVAGIDISGERKNTYPVFTSMEECDVEADAIIDFSSPKALDGILKYAKEKKCPVVLCTTGLTEEQLEQVKEASKVVPVLRSANMSLGINILMKVLRAVSKTLAEEGFDIEIVEKHHNQKLDAPSGTALALADTINGSLDEEYSYKYDRTSDRQKRPKKEIGISAVRGGSIVGEHEIIFAGQDEVIEFKHTAYSRALFGKGAVTAAKFLAGKEAGMYDMSDVLA